MKKKDKDQLHALKTAELATKAVELGKQISTALLERVTKEVKNRKIVKELRKTRAVALSILRLRELSERK